MWVSVAVILLQREQFSNIQSVHGGGLGGKWPCQKLWPVLSVKEYLNKFWPVRFELRGHLLKPAASGTSRTSTLESFRPSCSRPCVCFCVNNLHVKNVGFFSNCWLQISHRMQISHCEKKKRPSYFLDRGQLSWTFSTANNRINQWCSWCHNDTNNTGWQAH